MDFLITTTPNKPNRIEIPEFEKNEDYHVKYARWVIGSGSTQLHRDFLNNYKINSQFYMNKQWLLTEDTEAFFKDESGQDRNRLKVTRNYIQPMVEQYRGNAERMTFDMKVANLSPMARSRRELGLAKLLLYNDVARDMSGFGDYMKSNNMPVGSSTEIEDKYSNLYSDKNIISIIVFYVIRSIQIILIRINLFRPEI